MYLLNPAKTSWIILRSTYNWFNNIDKFPGVGHHLLWTFIWNIYKRVREKRNVNHPEKKIGNMIPFQNHKHDEYSQIHKSVIYIIKFLEVLVEE